MIADMAQVRPVILSGGSGTRLWPLSSNDRPKQFLALTGEHTMLQLTVERFFKKPGFLPPIIISNARHRVEIERQMRDIGLDGMSLMLEPQPRNTAAAIALAAFRAQPDDILLIMPSDHVIADIEGFRLAIETALPAAERGFLVTFGITPDAAETGYGYIRKGEMLFPGMYRAGQFVEKPDGQTAQLYVTSGEYSWNAGIFLFRVGAFLKALASHAPDIFDACREAVDRGTSEGECFYPDEAAFCRSSSVSVDYAIMEKADHVAVMPVDIGWSDIGSWDALHAYLGGDEKGNVLDEKAVAMGVRNCLIQSDGPIVAAVGVENLIIIATADAVLVMPRGESQRVKEVLEEVRRKGR
jgi:mannose-1-phosphate guanylyltransferase/mannose-1-phosphate guanylyltransferase/mannose-6-phosphate isomerase